MHVLAAGTAHNLAGLPRVNLESFKTSPRISDIRARMIVDDPGAFRTKPGYHIVHRP